MNKRIIAVLLAVALLLGTEPPLLVYAEDETEQVQREVIEIQTAEELMAFAEKCNMDAWSADKVVSLKDDISLSDVEFTGIPIFDGLFEGNAHTISDFNYQGSGYVAGLFRYIGTHGVVRNLTVQGNVISQDGDECVGGLCGVNRGIIENCRFRGSVDGRTEVGGIAGVNESTGTIQSSEASGTVSGYYYTGGIAGKNHGTISGCSNQSSINDNVGWVEESDRTTGVGWLQAGDEEENTRIQSSLDTGGIAGYSDGTIVSCTNRGTVGYAHTGYNIGGIAGRQAGVLTSCINEGRVYGRKDVGGIVGQMEPYILVSRARSVREELQELHDLIDKTLTDMGDGKEAISRDRDALRSYADGALAQGQKMSDELAGFAEKNLDAANQLTDGMEDVIRQIAENSQAVSRDLSQALEDWKNQPDNFEQVEDDTERLLQELRDQAGRLDTSRLSGVEFQGLSQEFKDSSSAFHSQLEGIADSLSGIAEHADGNLDVLNDDLRAVNNQLNVVMMLFLDRMEQLEQGESLLVYEDISQEDIEETTEGKVSQCINAAAVSADINVGGIAGAMSIDDDDPEVNALREVTASLESTYLTKCIASNCRNNGRITAKKDGVGGIVGYMSLGLVSGCEAYGSAVSQEGDYAGGVCGNSLAMIQDCYALMILSAGKYVGGIAGYGDGIRNCCAMLDAEAPKGRVGAIAGQLDLQEGEDLSENVSGNYYVEEGLAGIDNISYAGVAEPLTYQELLALEGIPQEFRHLKVTFLADDEVVATQELKYGDSMEQLAFPELEGVDDTNVIWPDVSGKRLLCNQILVAEYEDVVTVLESEAKGQSQEGADGIQKALAYVEGEFTSKSVLVAEENSELRPDGTVLSGRECRVYDISLKQAPPSEEEKSFALRLLKEKEGDAEIWQYQADGSWKQTEAIVRGSYLQTSLPGTEGTICILYKNSADWLLWLAAGGGAALVIAAGALIRKKRKKTKKQAVRT